jgi:amidase
MVELSDDKVIFEFSDACEPALTIASGDTVRIRTKDCFGNQLQTQEDSIDALDWNNVNPATGPVFVEGARAGDVLKVELLKVEVDDHTAMCTGTGEGTLGDVLKNGLLSNVKPIRGGKLVWDEDRGVKIDLKPMIGVIGVAPADGQAINCGTPGHHGGNMDNTQIGEGTTLYFPVACDGALFGCGDMHAVMGDGEIGVCGAEVAGHVTARLTALHDRTINNPILEDADRFMTIASAPTLDEACDTAVHEMVDILMQRTSGISEEDLVMLLSLVADVEVCQIVDPLRTARFVVPKKIVNAYGFTW